MMKNKEMRKENVLLFCFKIQQLQLSFEEKSSSFAAPEAIRGFSAAWHLSIVGQAAKATYIRWLVRVHNNFVSLRIVEGSAGAIVAASQIKAVKLHFFSTSTCFSFCFLHAPVSNPFTNIAIHSTVWIH